MNYSFKEYLEGKFSKQLLYAVSKLIDEDNQRELPVRIKLVYIKHINTAILTKFEDYVELPAILSVETSCSEDGKTYRRSIDVSCKICGTFSNSFDDFRLCSMNIRKSLSCCKQDTFIDDLLPYLTKEQMEKEAERLIERGYGYSYDKYRPQRIDSLAIAKALGIKVYFARLSENSDVRGIYVFEDGEICIYDDTIRAYRMSRVHKNSILIEKNIRDKAELVRFTIMHELVHAYTQRFAFYLMAMCRNSSFEVRCPIRIYDEDGQFMDNFTERAERQADTIAAYVLMPEISFKKKVIDIQTSYGVLRDSGCIKEMVDKTAKYFGVSISAARRRMYELGFTEVHGVYNFIDGKYVPPFSFKADSLQTHQTYCVSEKWAKKLLDTNKKLLKMVAKGVICYVENHFILNDPIFLTKDKKLTPYGREHLHECALKFDLIFPDRCGFKFKSDNKLAFRTAEASLPITMAYSNDNTDLEEQARQLCMRNTEVLELVKRMPEDFGESLTQVVEWTEMTREQIAVSCWVNEKTIYRLCNNITENPSINMVVQLCIGMSLPFEVSMKLMERAGYRPRNNLRDMTIMHLLILSYKYNIEDCNKLLIAQGLAPLVVKNPAA